MSNESQRRWAMLLLAALSLGVALRLSQPVMAPLALAFVTAVLLTPIRDLWIRLGAGPTLAAVMTAVGGMLLFAAVAVLLQPAFQTALAEWPSMKAELKSALGEMRQMVREIYNLQEEVMDAIDPSGGGEADPGAVLPSLADAAFLAPQVLGQALVFLGGVFFFLLSRNELYVWFAKFLNSNSDTDDWSVDDFARADRTVTRYFSTVAAINTAFGIAVAIALSLIGLPGAIIWGMVAALTNFVVYLGAAVTAALLILAGTVSFDGWMAMLPAAAFIAINFLEGQFVTPSVVGRQMRINPLLVFVTLTFSVWLWGAIGGIVAIPLIVWMMALVADGGAHEAQPVTTEPVEA